VLNIIAIGGGDLAAKETLPIDKVIVEATGKEQPNALFIPTASQDALDYFASFEAMYGGELGCPTKALFLVREEPTREEIQATIDWADLVYVGGGNTRTMLIRWRELGVDKVLRAGADRGLILSGLSAGANCWFRYANSDAPMMEGRTDILTMRLECLGFIDVALCPHMKREEFRPSEFKGMMRTTPGVGLGIDDCCALQIKDDTYRIHSCEEGSVVHRMQWAGDNFRHERLEPHDDFRPLDQLIHMADA
jgi:dipeptidase E